MSNAIPCNPKQILTICHEFRPLPKLAKNVCPQLQLWLRFYLWMWPENNRSWSEQFKKDVLSSGSRSSNYPALQLAHHPYHPFGATWKVVWLLGWVSSWAKEMKFSFILSNVTMRWWSFRVCFLYLLQPFIHPTVVEECQSQIKHWNCLGNLTCPSCGLWFRWTLFWSPWPWIKLAVNVFIGQVGRNQWRVGQNVPQNVPLGHFHRTWSGFTVLLSASFVNSRL